MEPGKLADEIRALLARERDGMLSTISKKAVGWPFGSIAPYALNDAGEPILLISEIAEHTRNLRADARSSLLVRDSKATDDPQAGARATVMGYAMPVPAPFINAARQRYLGLFPNSSGYFEVHDFTLFQLKVSQIRYIGGFGEIHWVDGNEIINYSAYYGADPVSRHAGMICDHMNQDHTDALMMFARKLGSIDAQSAKMIHVDGEGFDLVGVQDGAHRHLRIAFPERISTAEEARGAMVELVRRVRAQ
jgi:heme iron utilization protein